MNVTDALKQIKALQKKFKKLDNNVVKRLAELGENEATMNFSGAIGYDENDVVVSATVENNTARITAQGKDVAFLEFGAGLKVGMHPLTNNFGLYPGVFSEKNAKQFSEKGRWYYKDVRYTFVQPTMSMYNASQKIRQEAKKIVTEEITK